MRLVLDTSVVVSGLISAKGSPAFIISQWISGAFTMLYSQAMLAELEDVLHRTWLTERLATTPDRVPDFLSAVVVLGELVSGYINVGGAVRDPFDEMFLACAVLGHADYLVTVDKDLLVLRQYEQTHILNPAEFLGVLSQYNDW
jgi:putative PIN family toxin of toxin-antitoxin system